MNYKKLYDALISRAHNRITIDGYTEVHHIIPLCIGGTNNKSNLVKLTAREHFVAHQLLHKMHPCNDKLLYAIHIMTVSAPNQYRNNRLYEWVRIKHAKRMSNLHKNKIVSNETKEKMSIAAKKRGNNGWQGRTHSDQTKQKMSDIKKLTGYGIGSKNNNVAEWKITKITGESTIIKSLTTYCLENNLSLYKMRNNKYNDCKVEKL